MHETDKSRKLSSFSQFFHYMPFFDKVEITSIFSPIISVNKKTTSAAPPAALLVHDLALLTGMMINNWSQDFGALPG